MNHMCCIIRDMLPLYLDGMLSEDSVAFVEEHLQGCEPCREELEKLKLDVPQVTELAYELKKSGIDLPDGIISVDECADALEKLLSESK